MKISVFFKAFVTVGLSRLAKSFIAIFGFLWLLIEPVALFFPDQIQHGWLGYLTLILVSMILAIAWRFPRRSISKALSSPDSVVEIKIGDLFDEPGHLVIGTNDVFDTELGNVIKSASVQGQFLSRIYDSDRTKLDVDIEAALTPYEHKRQKDPQKTIGKHWRYPLGTTITLGPLNSRYFLIAYGYMGNDLKCISDADSIWLSLSQLWEEVRRKGQGAQVAIPILGSDLARTGLPRMTLIKMIVISFLVASKKEFVTKKLTIVVYPEDLGFVNLYDLEGFLTSACF
jgi:hypothetical protein